ncbi:MAG: ATP-binding cassette domain-containing protein [Bacteroidales bacterium]|nr:ATP-binding cassette domain-containing protein [Bacteroidales bacterium]MCM1148339.1 ATP-binding cassette domain-containing protein [Bacteroidales bacterium]MCM1206968.1 ATP-binding cassette domain-containing protein [Bacillota bacterium]MCM1511264.1 ATP-binding cassette domain-containing protein [Clostridium sp.]
MQKIIDIENGVCRMSQWCMAEPVNFSLCQGEHIAIVGPNGGGKSMLVDIITGAHALLPMNPVRYDFSPRKARLVSDNIKYMTFRDSYGTADGNYYYQQRWNQNDIEESPIVVDLLDEAFRIAEEGLVRKTVFDRFVVREETPGQEAARLSSEETDRKAMHEELEKVRRHLYDMFGLERLLDKHVILLSSGELRKFQLTKTLLANPRVLIMDNPFIGLDSTARRQLHDFLKVLAAETTISIILVQSKSDDIPDFITHVVEVKDMSVGGKKSLAEYREQALALPQHVLSMERKTSIASLPDEIIGADRIIDFNNVNIRYGSRTILKDLTFSVKKGEHWALSGENGAGKSTLLSLICADNPQAYANDIVLFGHRRGNGESIWDIKKHIGYISPEMHRAFLRDLPCLHIVASGMSDMNGLYQKPKQHQVEQCLFWMRIFSVEHLADRTFLKLSSGEQRLVLLARAFVKDPALLILDEPLHGLDLHNRCMVKEIINTFCQRPGKTLIMVTHYKEELPDCIDHEIFLKRIN